MISDKKMDKIISCTTSELEEMSKDCRKRYELSLPKGDKSILNEWFYIIMEMDKRY